MRTPPTETLFIPGAVVRHGIIALQQELDVLLTIAAEDSSKWPNDFEPNDIGLYESVLASMEEGQENGFEDAYWWGKPFRFFVGLLTAYIEKSPSISKQDTEVIVRTLCEYHIRTCLWYAGDPSDTFGKESAIKRCVSNVIDLFSKDR